MSSPNIEQSSEILSFFCQIDTYLGVKDYLRGGRCLRLIGINKKDFLKLSQQDIGHGVVSFVIDVDLWEFIRKAPENTWTFKQNDVLEQLHEYESQISKNTEWIYLELVEIPNGLSYFYTTFSEETPKRFTIKKITATQGPNLISLLPDSKDPLINASILSTEITTKGVDVFSAFHVGQGMCSAVYNDSSAILFDAGAGTPITRKRYLNKRKFRNDIITKLLDSRRIHYLVLSHYDYDHWRLIAWDNGLLSKIEEIIAPDSTNLSLAFFDQQIHGKLKQVGGFNVKFGSCLKVKSVRSQPKYTDSNGECLVTLITLNEQTALIPGDYVYERMANDNNPWIASLPLGQYSALIVPHHGDKASANKVPLPVSASSSKAFFSAGNHKGFNHPTVWSLNAHKQRQFVVSHPQNLTDIVEFQLIP